MNTTTIRVGMREIAVEQTPLPTSFLRSHGPFIISRPLPTCLVIENPRLVRFVGWGCGLAGWVLFPLGVLGLFVHPALWLIVFWGAVMLFLWVRCMGTSYRFDTEDGYLTIRQLWNTRRRHETALRRTRLRSQFHAQFRRAGLLHLSTERLAD